jgi:hypothetical protein
MSTPIAEQVQEAIASQTQLMESAEQFQRLESVIALFDDLVSRGLTKRRGYNLMTAAERLHGHTGLSVNTYNVDTSYKLIS